MTNADGDNWFTLGGYYSDRLVRDGSDWRISGKKLVVTWNRGNRSVLNARGRARAPEARRIFGRMSAWAARHGPSNPDQ